MKNVLVILGGLAMASAAMAGSPLGLPDVPIPEDNPQTAEKIALGARLFNDVRFSSTGEVSCASCHVAASAFTDSPLQVSEGIEKLTGTRNAPTVVNAAFNKTQFWDGRSPSLEDQALHPFLNPVEMGLPSHDPILGIVRDDESYARAFKSVFGVKAEAISMDEVTKAIAAFERTEIAGNSPFDRWYFGGEKDAISEQAVRGFAVFLGNGRCVSCHTIEQDFALFTDHQFHNVGIGINDIQEKVPELARTFQIAKNQGMDVDVAVLSDADTSHLGRFAVDDQLSSMGAFKTSTLRNIAVTAPYMHDGSLMTLREVVDHYNNGGVSKEGDPINPFLGGGIRPLDLTEQEIDDLVTFMETLTSPRFEPVDNDLVTSASPMGDLQ
ncbi:MAG: cytochrome-c peroxidase [Gammaproteobacteria bacterium]|nr:cytochrome-c peroxidase [Gammaproteobacteria bacterium]